MTQYISLFRINTQYNDPNYTIDSILCVQLYIQNYPIKQMLDFIQSYNSLDSRANKSTTMNNGITKVLEQYISKNSTQHSRQQDVKTTVNRMFPWEDYHRSVGKCVIFLLLLSENVFANERFKLIRSPTKPKLGFVCFMLSVKISCR